MQVSDVACCVEDTPETKANGSSNGSTQVTTDTPAVRLGLMYVSGLRTEAAEIIVAERNRKPFTSVDDFVPPRKAAQARTRRAR